MRIGVLRGLDIAPLLAAVVAVLMTVVYVRVVGEQDDDPLPWVLAVLGLATLGSLYGVPISAPHRRPTLAVTGLLLGGLGLVAILTIGLPIMAAGALCLIGATRPPAAPLARS